MKTSSINLFAIIKVSSAVIVFLAFSACSKESFPKCEKWEVEEQGTIKCIIDLGCGGRTLQLTFCGDGLKDAYAGNTVITRDDDCCTLTRTFIRVVR